MNFVPGDCDRRQASRFVPAAQPLISNQSLKNEWYKSISSDTAELCPPAHSTNSSLIAALDDTQSEIIESVTESRGKKGRPAGATWSIEYVYEERDRMATVQKPRSIQPRPSSTENRSQRSEACDRINPKRYLFPMWN